MASILQTTFQNNFLALKLLYFDSIFTEHQMQKKINVHPSQMGKNAIRTSKNFIIYIWIV